MPLSPAYEMIRSLSQADMINITTNIDDLSVLRKNINHDIDVGGLIEDARLLLKQCHFLKIKFTNEVRLFVNSLDWGEGN